MDQFKTLARFTTVIEAELVKLMLESKGIRSYILDGNLSFSLGATLSQGIRLQVKAEDFERASLIYQNSLKTDQNNLENV